MKAAERASGIRPDIIAAAAKVFGARGYQQATLDEIAGLLGIKKGSLYYHIESKEQLLFAIYLQLFSALESATLKAVSDADGEPLAQLENVIVAIVEIIYDNRDTASVFLHEYRALNTMHLRHRLKDRNALLLRLEGILKRVFLSENIDSSAYSPRIAAMGVLGMCNWISDWIDSGVYSREMVAGTFTKMILDGIRSRAESASAQELAPLKAKKVRRRAA